MVDRREQLPKGTIILGKNRDRGVYISAIMRAKAESGNDEAHIRVYLNSYDDEGYATISKLASILTMLKLQIKTMFMDLIANFITVVV